MWGHDLPCKTKQKLHMSPQVLDLLCTFPQKSLGHISCQGLRFLGRKMIPLQDPMKTGWLPACVEPAFHFSPKVSWAHFLWTAPGPDLESDLLCETQRKLERLPQVLNLLSTFSEKPLGHILCEQLRGLTWKVTSLAGPTKNWMGPRRC